MTSVSLPCPSCGAVVPFQSSAALLAVCPHCRTMMLRKDLDVESLGVVAQLQKDASPVQLGARGHWDGADFSVVGRIQMRYDQGIWNEWFVFFEDARQGWLGEAQGLYAMSFRKDAVQAPAFDTLQLGARVDLAGESYEVKDLREAEYASAEGELPSCPPLGEKADFADLVSADGGFATLDYSEDPPLVFAGRYVGFDALKLTGLREFEGW